MTTPSLREVSQGQKLVGTIDKPVRKSFAALLANMSGKTAVVSKGKSGPVKPATVEQVAKEIPELIQGCWSGDYQPLVNDRGETSSVFHDEHGIGGCKGAVYTCRNFVRLTPAIAAYILENYKGHNRDTTLPAVKRYTDAQLLPSRDPNAWHYVGNTLGFVVAKNGDIRSIGQCNGGHTCHAVVKSGKTILVNIYFGVPEQFANLADVNIPRTAKDTIGRLHRFDKYNELTELDGEPLPITIKASDVKSMNNVHSQALRILACVQAGKKVKDSEPLGPGAIAALDAKFGTVLESCVLKTYLLDRAAVADNGKGKAVAGALKKRVSLSHAAAVMALLATEESSDGLYELNADAVYAVESFFAEMVDENDTDEDNPAVALRTVMENFKLDKMTDQNIRWLVLKRAIAAASENDIDASVDTLSATSADDKLTFGTPLDPNEEDEPEVNEIDEETEEEEAEE